MEEAILKEIMGRILKALKNLNPEFIQFMDYDSYLDGKPLIQVTVVTSGVEDIRQPTRWRICDDILSQREPELTKQYVFAFEVYTPLEYKMVKLEKQRLH